MATDGEDKRAPLLEDSQGNITEQFVSFDAFKLEAAALVGSVGECDVSKVVRSARPQPPRSRE